MADKCVGLLESLPTFIFSGNIPKRNSIIRKVVDKLMVIMIDLGLCDASRGRGEINTRMPFTPNSLVRSVAGGWSAGGRTSKAPSSWNPFVERYVNDYAIEDHCYK